jgi:hypothetical protein
MLITVNWVVPESGIAESESRRLVHPFFQPRERGVPSYLTLADRGQCWCRLSCRLADEKGYQRITGPTNQPRDSSPPSIIEVLTHRGDRLRNGFGASQQTGSGM